MKLNSDALSNIFGVRNPSPSTQSKNSRDMEVKNYILENCIQLDEDPLNWWRINERKYPILSMISKHLLSAPATSVASERIFSKAGHILNLKRASLGSSLVDQLVFLSHNQK